MGEGSKLVGVGGTACRHWHKLCCVSFKDSSSS